MPDLILVKRALLSVSDKSGLEELAKVLHQRKVEIISSGGTGKFLASCGIPFIPIEKVTGNPEAFSGRMKTLSFQISSALLFRRDSEEDLKQAVELGIQPIDLVVCNLYPFEEVVKRKGELAELVENIDIGGPTMIRAAAKNFAAVTVATSPTHYPEIIAALENKEGQLGLDLRKKMAKEAFRRTASYDTLIANQLEKACEDELPSIPLTPQNAKELRYGENPHQKGWLYKHPTETGLASATPLQGKALSYNNLLDADAALRCTSDLARSAQEPHSFAVSVIKHLNPCGAAISKTLLDALKLAWDGDPVSSFGSIICFSSEVDEGSALWLKDKFVEVLLAPSFSSAAKEIFSKKKNLRLIPTDLLSTEKEYVVRSISGGWVVQTADQGKDEAFENKTEKVFPLTKHSLAQFGITVGKYLKSNAIVLVQESELGMSVIGAGMGNPNRLVSLRQSVEKAKENGHQSLSEAVLISDAFFPFPDNIEMAHQAGIQYVVQPGGSIKDKDVIQACDKAQMSMLFTGRRHFVH